MDWIYSSEFCVSLFTAIFVYLITKYDDLKKSRNLIRGYSLLVFMEVNDHIHHLENINSAILSIDEQFTSDEWEKCRYFLATNLPFKDFAKVMEHYRTVKAIKKVLMACDGQPPHDFVERYLAIAIDAHNTLFRYAKLDMSLVQEYNKLRHEELYKEEG